MTEVMSVSPAGLLIGLGVAAVVGAAAGALIALAVRDRQESADVAWWRARAGDLAAKTRGLTTTVRDLRALVGEQTTTIQVLAGIAREHRTVCAATRARLAIDADAHAQLLADIDSWQARAATQHDTTEGRAGPSGPRGDDGTTS
jgi:hypothetical protein